MYHDVNGVRPVYDHHCVYVDSHKLKVIFIEPEEAQFNLPTRSLFGPTSIEFQLKETFEGQLVKPSWCLLVNTTYLDNTTRYKTMIQ